MKMVPKGCSGICACTGDCRILVPCKILHPDEYDSWLREYSKVTEPTKEQIDRLKAICRQVSGI